MLNDSISTLLARPEIFKDQSPETLKAISSESEIICESIEYGLMHLGEMISRLGYLADEEQEVTDIAITNDNAKHIGNLIKANAYLLNTMRNTTDWADYYRNEKGGK